MNSVYGFPIIDALCAGNAALMLLDQEVDENFDITKLNPARESIQDERLRAYLDRMITEVEHGMKILLQEEEDDGSIGEEGYWGAGVDVVEYDDLDEEEEEEEEDDDDEDERAEERLMSMLINYRNN